MRLLSNSLSLIRAPAALFFLHENVQLRLCAVLVAMFTDSIDGYIARRYCSTSSFGAVIDPLMDKFFVYLALSVLFLEAKIPLWACFAMTSRDLFVLFNGAYLQYTKRWPNYHFRSVLFGKMTTAAQFFIIAAITLNYSFPSGLYLVFVLFGSCAFLELFASSRNTPISKV